MPPSATRRGTRAKLVACFDRSFGDAVIPPRRRTSKSCTCDKEAPQEPNSPSTHTNSGPLKTQTSWEQRHPRSSPHPSPRTVVDARGSCHGPCHLATTCPQPLTPMRRRASQSAHLFFFDPSWTAFVSADRTGTPVALRHRAFWGLCSVGGRDRLGGRHGGPGLEAVEAADRVEDACPKRSMGWDGAGLRGFGAGAGCRCQQEQVHRTL